MTNFFVYGQALFISTTTGARFLALLLDSAKSPVDHNAQLHISVQCAVSDILSPLVEKKGKGRNPVTNCELLTDHALTH
jgi:hypothetical protein